MGSEMCIRDRYTRGVWGEVKVPKSYSENVLLIASGSGAYGQAGRIGGWDDYLLQVEDDSFVWVRPSGGKYKTPPYYLYFGKKSVYTIPLSELDVFCDSRGIDVPTELVNIKSKGQ